MLDGGDCWLAVVALVVDGTRRLRLGLGPTLHCCTSCGWAGESQE